MKRVLVPAFSVCLAAAGGLGTSALASPSATGVTHANVHVCAAPVAGYAACNAIRHDTYVNGKPAPTGTAGPTGYNPVDLQSAYQLTTAAGANGAGKTVAIVDAYDLPTAANDLALYRATENLPPLAAGGPTFTQVGQHGGARPAVNASWGQEIALDIEMVSAICPKCNILLVEANSASFADLSTAVSYAASVPGVVAISNSYGGGETSPISAYNQPGIAVTASSGDGGFGVESPASFPAVTAVGGTSLKRTSTGRLWSETAWSGAGSGCARYSAQPGWQTGVVKNCGTRAIADVSAVADPNTGVSVYDSTAYSGSSGWMVFGGTSVASPIIAGVYALGSGAYSAQTPYQNIGSLYDVTSGSNGRCRRTPALCTAGSGWDGPTGLGTPNGTGAF